MPQMSIRKVKRATVLTRKMQFLRKYYMERSYKPLYEKVKSNNSNLAKALSHEKKNNQSLFTQNLALLSEIQELRLGYNAQDNVITTVLSNTKEMLKMLVTMSGYMTNTISMCQEYVTSSTTARLSSAPIGRKDSIKRLSTKAPAKGVVKPMVSGHTITKPIINLSRVNMESINNPSRLTNIPEISTPNRSSLNRSQIDETGSPITVPMAITPLRYENVSTRRMPERLAVPSSSRLNDALATNDERRLNKKKSRRSKKLSGSFSRSRSSRWSDETPRRSTDHVNQLGSPTVQLNDVSKFLQNSHTINIRRLIDNVDLHENEPYHDTSGKNVIIPETQVSINVDETCALERDSNVHTINKISDKDLTSKHPNVRENLKSSQNNAWEEDPLEGPSWLFNNTLTVPLRDNEPEESNHLQVSDFNNNTSDLVEYDDDDSSVTEGNLEESSPLNVGNLVETNNASALEKDAAPISDHTDIVSHSNNHDADNNFCEIVPAASLSAYERNLDNMEADSINSAGFVTLRRGPSEEIEEETEDFTLMLTRQPVRNIHFDINELRLPSPEEQIINVVDDDESDTEEVAISNMSNVPVSNLASNQDQNIVSEYHRNVIKTSPTPGDDHIDERTLTSRKKKYSKRKNKRAGISSIKYETGHIENDLKMINKTKQKSKSKKNQDPSTAKVVLQKLNRSDVQQRISINGIESQDDNYEAMRNDISNQMQGFDDTEAGVSSNHASNRPRRRKAPTGSFKEPNMRKKLRRSK